MLHEPEASLVAAWLAENVPRQIPQGVSGAGLTFMDTARARGFAGFFKRFGVAHVERQAFVFIARGLITVAQARAGVCWTELSQNGPMNSPQMGARLSISKNAALMALTALVTAGAAEPVPHPRQFIARACGTRAPAWWDFLPEAERAA